MHFQVINNSLQTLISPYCNLYINKTEMIFVYANYNLMGIIQEHTNINARIVFLLSAKTYYIYRKHIFYLQYSSLKPMWQHV